LTVPQPPPPTVLYERKPEDAARRHEEFRHEEVMRDIEEEERDRRIKLMLKVGFYSLVAALIGLAVYWAYMQLRPQLDYKSAQRAAASKSLPAARNAGARDVSFRTGKTSSAEATRGRP
jgi:hypothetical protein